MRVAGRPSLPDAVGAEVDILGVGFAIELRRKEAHDVHPGLAAIACELAHSRAIALTLGQTRGELVDDMAQPMGLLLAYDLACDAAGILDVLVAVEHLRHRGR